MLVRRLVLLALIAAISTVLVAGAAARSASPLAATLTSDRAVARYLTTLGIDPKGVVVQRGTRNYAGPHCPGTRWNCTSALRVLQVSTAAGGVNLVTCSGAGGTATGSGAGTGNLGCTIVQTATGATSNVATCVEQSLVAAPAAVTQNCSITQTSVGGSNKATVSQSIQQGPICGLVPSIASSMQTQTATQTATVTQDSPTGNGTASVSQDASQCVATFTTGSTTQSQTTDQEFTIGQNMTGFNPTSPACTAQGMLSATATQTQHQYGFAPFAGSGTELQHADLLGHVDQCGVNGPGTLGLADYKASQAENQFLYKNSHVLQTQQGPASLKGGKLPASKSRTLQRGHCCSFQGQNTGDTCTITQTTSQQANANAVQTEDLTENAGTSGICSGTSTATQNATTKTDTSSGQTVDTSVQCQSGVCGPFPTVLTWTGATGGAYHETVVLAAKLTRSDTSAPLSGQTVALAVDAADSCSAITDSGGLASCTVNLTRTPATPSYQATATFAATSQYLASSTSADFTVTKRNVVISALGPSSEHYNDPVTLTATLAEAPTALDSGQAVNAGEPVTFTLGTQTCSGTTSATGVATCTIAPITQAPGPVTLTATFAEDADYFGQTASTSFTITKEEFVVAYSGQTSGDYSDPATFKGTLKDDDGVTPLAGRKLTFKLGVDSCTTGPTNASGFASCSISKVSETTGFYPITVSIGTDTYYQTGPITLAQSFTVTTEETDIRYTGPTSAKKGTSATVSAKLSWDDGPIVGSTLTFTLSSGGSCTGTTNSSGVASCSLAVGSTPGYYTLKTVYAGDPQKFEPDTTSVTFKVTSF